MSTEPAGNNSMALGANAARLSNPLPAVISLTDVHEEPETLG